MTEIAEMVAAPNLAFSEDKCPFCNKDPNADPHDSQPEEVDIDKIKSIPSNLGDLSIGQKQGDFGRARHHLIPAIQCFKQVRRLAKMALLAGYDINNTNNGIGLPTVWNMYEVDGYDEPQNFGDLKEHPINEKEIIRNKVMKKKGLQWHVGNHHYTVPKDECRTENMSDEGSLDHDPYDVVVVRELLRIMNSLRKADLCDDGNQDKVVSELDELCKKIRAKLKAFKVPKKSKPYFVSQAALKFMMDFPNNA